MMTNPIVGGVEAKLHGYRKTQAGTVVSFLIHPEDKHETLANADLGTALKLAYESIDYDNPEPSQPRGEALARAGKVRPAEAQPEPVAKQDKRAWADVPPTEQACIRCNDKGFQEWVKDQCPVGWPETYDDPSELAKHWIYDQCCIESRADLNRESDAKYTWFELDRRFTEDTRLPERIGG